MNPENIAKSKEISDKVVIVSTVIYNPDLESDRIRSGLALDTLKNAGELGYEMILINNGVSDELYKDLQKYGAKIYSPANN